MAHNQGSGVGGQGLGGIEHRCIAARPDPRSPIPDPLTGTLVAQTQNSVTTRSTHDLAAPLSQVLSNGTQRYVYGAPAERLFAQVGTSPRTWYSVDALGSVRATLSDAGIPQAVASYDAWGMPETPLFSTGCCFRRQRHYGSLNWSMDERHVLSV